MDGITLNIWSVLILFGAVHAVFLAIVLLRKKENQQANRIFALLLLVICLHLTEYAVSISGITIRFPHIIATTFPLIFSIGPLLYFYVLKLLYPVQFRWVHVLHFFPVLLYALLLLPFYMKSGNEKVAYMLSLASGEHFEAPLAQLIAMYAQILQMFIYAFLVIRLINERRRALGDKLSKTNTMVFGWLKKVGYAFLFFVICFFITTTTLIIVKQYSVEIDYVILLIFSGLMFGIGYAGYNQPNIFDGIDWKVPSRNGLAVQECHQIIAALTKILDLEKPYLDEKLSIKALSERISVPYYQLSEAINTTYKTNFFEFINSYRVEEAKRLLADPSTNHLKILAIALESGFSNKATFNRVFKNFTGKTPSAYRKASQ